MLLIKYRFVKDAFQLPDHRWIDGIEISLDDTLLEVDNFASATYLSTVIDAIKRAGEYRLYIYEDMSDYTAESFGGFVNKLYKLPKPISLLNKSSNPMIDKWVAPLR